MDPHHGAMDTERRLPGPPDPSLVARTQRLALRSAMRPRPVLGVAFDGREGIYRLVINTVA